MSRRRRLPQGGFTFIEVLFTAVLLGLLVTSVQTAVTRLIGLKSLSQQEIEVYHKAQNILQWILSGKGIPDYVLTASERSRLTKKGAEFDSLQGFLPMMAKHRFMHRERKQIIKQGLKLDKTPYRVEVVREVLEPAPFLFGLVINVRDKQGNEATLKGILSYYDLERTLL